MEKKHFDFSLLTKFLLILIHDEKFLISLKIIMSYITFVFFFGISVLTVGSKIIRALAIILAIFLWFD